MATEWKEPMAWDNAGTAPSDNLKTQGFKAGDKPPASVFNYFLNKTAASINQLQDEVDSTNTALDAHKTDTTTKLGNKVDKVSGKGLSTNDYTTEEKNKLAGIATGATKVIVDSSLSSSSTNPVQNKVINSALAGKSNTGHTHTAASTSTDGFMSASDKSKLDGIAAGANAYSHPTTSGNKHIPSGGSSGQILRWSADGTATWGNDNNTTYSAATQSEQGLMTAADKKKLDGIATGANAYSLPSAGTSLGGVKSGGDVTIADGVITVNDDSHNHTISNVDGLQTALDGKSGTGHSHSAASASSAGFMSASDKSKLDGIATGANAYSLPTASSTTLGGVKTTSSVTSTSGLTACPIISGVPYYKDTDTKYSLSSFGVTSTAAELNILDGVTATTEELNYVDGVTSNIQTQLNGKSASNHTHKYAGSSSAGGVANSAVSTSPITTEGTGAAYTATVAGITALSAGVSFIMVPHTNSTSTTPTINVNGLGAKGIRRRLSNLSTSIQTGYAASWLGSGKAYTLVYDGSYWIVDGMSKPSADDFYGTMAVAKGGTGATTADQARTNLGAAPAYTYGTADLTAGMSTLATGTLYFVYE